MVDLNLEYYNSQMGKEFFQHSVNRPFENCYNKEAFKYLPKQGKILDAGCGSGGYTKYFLSLGYKVLAFDYSDQMVKLSSEVTGQPTLKLSFNDVDFIDEFDVIWASASLLHVSYDDLPMVVNKLAVSLKTNGIFYSSYKYGFNQRIVDNRLFFDHDETSLRKLFNKLHGFKEIDIWTSPDTSTKARSLMEKWIHAVYQKI